MKGLVLALFGEKISLRHSTTAEITIVRGWLAAANEQDVERLLALSLPEIAILDSSVQGSGTRLLRQWLADAGVRFTPKRFFQRDESVVLAQHGTPPTSESDSERTGEALRFRVRELRVVEVEHFDNLASALCAAGLSSADEASAPL